MTMQTDSAFDVAAATSVFTARRYASDRARPVSHDRCTIRNERIKLGSSFLNAIGLTLIAFALLRPITHDLSALTPLSFFWVGLGVTLHCGAHVMLGRLSDPEAPDVTDGIAHATRQSRCPRARMSAPSRGSL